MKFRFLVTGYIYWENDSCSSSSVYIDDGTAVEIEKYCVYAITYILDCDNPRQAMLAAECQVQRAFPIKKAIRWAGLPIIRMVSTDDTYVIPSSALRE